MFGLYIQIPNLIKNHSVTLEIQHKDTAFLLCIKYQHQTDETRVSAILIAACNCLLILVVKNNDSGEKFMLMHEEQLLL